MPADK